MQRLHTSYPPQGEIRSTKKVGLNGCVFEQYAENGNYCRSIIGLRYEDGDGEKIAYGLIKKIFFTNPFPDVPRNALAGFYVYVAWYTTVLPIAPGISNLRLSARRGVWPLVNAVPTNYMIMRAADIVTIIDQERQYV